MESVPDGVIASQTLAFCTLILYHVLNLLTPLLLCVKCPSATLIFESIGDSPEDTNISVYACDTEIRYKATPDTFCSRSLWSWQTQASAVQVPFSCASASVFQLPSLVMWNLLNSRKVEYSTG